VRESYGNHDRTGRSGLPANLNVERRQGAPRQEKTPRLGCLTPQQTRRGPDRMVTVRQKDDAPEVQRRLLRPTYTVSDMKEGLEGTRYQSGSLA